MGERNLKSNRSGFTFDELIAGERPEEFIESAQPFMKLMIGHRECWKVR